MSRTKVQYNFQPGWGRRGDSSSLRAAMCIASQITKVIKIKDRIPNRKANIHPIVPRIIASYDEVEIKRNSHKSELGKLVNTLLDQELRPEIGIFKVLMLSAPDAPETLKLDCPTDSQSSIR